MVEQYFRDSNGRNFYDEIRAMDSLDFEEFRAELEDEDLYLNRNIKRPIEELVSDEVPFHCVDGSNASEFTLYSDGLLMISGETIEEVETTKYSWETIAGYDYVSVEAGAVV